MFESLDLKSFCAEEDVLELRRLKAGEADSFVKIVGAGMATDCDDPVPYTVDIFHSSLSQEG